MAGYHGESPTLTDRGSVEKEDTILSAAWDRCIEDYEKAVNKHGFNSEQMRPYEERAMAILNTRALVTLARKGNKGLFDNKP